MHHLKGLEVEIQCGKRSWGGEWGFDRSFKNRDPAKVAPVMGEVEEYAEGTAL